MYVLSYIKGKILKRKPYILKLYNWNSTRTSAHCSSKDFDKVFSGFNCIYDADKDITFAPFHVGDLFITVIRDKDV